MLRQWYEKLMYFLFGIRPASEAVASVSVTKEEFQAARTEMKADLENHKIEFRGFQNEVRQHQEAAKTKAAGKAGSYFVKMSNHTGERTEHTDWHQKPQHK
jgi:hypothetical protein